MLKAVILDWGGVLMRTVDPSGRRKWERKLDLSLHAVDRVVHGSRSWKQAQSGIISDAEYWADVADQLGLDETALAEFRHDYFSGDRLDEEMVQFIQDLRPRFKTALLSNASPQLLRLLEELEVTGLFDVMVISGMVGVQKPDPDIYRLVLKRLGLRPQETIFVDDFPRNLETAQELGMQTLHFRAGMDWKRELSRRLGVDEKRGTKDERRTMDDG
jgi:putative hydrolase of the HAD superfamily